MIESKEEQKRHLAIAPSPPLSVVGDQKKIDPRYLKGKDRSWLNRELKKIEEKLKNKPDDYIVLNDKANALYYLGKYFDALVTFCKASKLKPNQDEKNCIEKFRKDNPYYLCGNNSENICLFNEYFQDLFAVYILLIPAIHLILLLVLSECMRNEFIKATLWVGIEHILAILISRYLEPKTFKFIELYYFVFLQTTFTIGLPYFFLMSHQYPHHDACQIVSASRFIIDTFLSAASFLIAGSILDIINYYNKYEININLISANYSHLTEVIAKDKNWLSKQLKKCEKQLESKPNDYILLNDKANMYYFLGNYNQARMIFEKILKLKPTQSEQATLEKFKKDNPCYLLAQDGQQACVDQISNYLDIFSNKFLFISHFNLYVLSIMCNKFLLGNQTNFVELLYATLASFSILVVYKFIITCENSSLKNNFIDPCLFHILNGMSFSAWGLLSSFLIANQNTTKENSPSPIGILALPLYYFSLEVTGTILKYINYYTKSKINIHLITTENSELIPVEQVIQEKKMLQAELKGQMQQTQTHQNQSERLSNILRDKDNELSECRRRIIELEAKLAATERISTELKSNKPNAASRLASLPRGFANESSVSSARQKFGVFAINNPIDTNPVSSTQRTAQGKIFATSP